MARSVFKINKVCDKTAARGPNSNLICYGDKLKITANKKLFGKDKIIYLSSGHCTTQTYAKISHHQEVLFTTKGDQYSCVWEFEHSDPKIRFEMSGEPISVDDQVLLKHSHTANWLGSESSVVKNLYGQEMEVFVHSYYDAKKTQNLIAERVGRTTGDTPLRGQGVQNLFAIISAQRESDEFDENSIKNPFKLSDVMSSITIFTRNKGAYGLKTLRQMLNRIDESRTGFLDIDDLKWGLKNYGLLLSEEELRSLFTEFDTQQNGTLSYNAF